MRPKGKIERTRNFKTQQERSLRRSIRIRNESGEQTGPLTRSATAARVTKKDEHVAKTKFSTRKSKKKLQSNVEAPAKSLKKHSDKQTRKSTKQGTEKRQQRSRTHRLITESNTKVGLNEIGPKKRRAEATRKTMTKKRKIRQAAITQPLQTNTENVPTWQHKITFGTEIHYYGSNDVTRFCDVAFLDDNHILAVDDAYIHAKEGYRVCCFRLDGTLVADLPLPGYPWTIVALSDNEAVVTLRRTKSRGLMWLFIDIERRIIIPTRTVTMKHDAYGIAYNKEKEIYVVSHYQTRFLTILNKDGDEIGKVPVPEGSTYRCTFSGEYIIYIDLAALHVKAIELSGCENFEFTKKYTFKPIDIDRDIEGNIYVANYCQNVCQFDSRGNYTTTLFDDLAVCGIGLNRKSDLMAVTHGKSVSIYQFQN